MVPRSLPAVWIALVLLPTAAGAERPARITWRPEAPRQGDPLLVEVRPRRAADKVTATFLGHAVTFVPWGEGRWRALAPVSVKTAPGDHALVVTLYRGGRTEVDRRPITIAAADFPESRLSVSGRYTRPAKAVRRRVRRDHGHVRAAWGRGTTERLWRAPFRAPVDTPKTGEFGTRRTFNGRVKSRHLGVDLDGARGDPVHAAARGRVVLAEPLYYSGNTVLLDHGGGLFTVYFHLSEIAVAPGDLVDVAGLLGKVGATGRVTGPHLHFGVKLDGVYVNPERLLALDLGPDPDAEARTASAATGGGD